MGRYATVDDLKNSYDLRFAAEMEMVPLAHAIFEGDCTVARMMRDNMLVRSEATRAYKRFAELKDDDDLLEGMTEFMTDEYMILAIQALERVPAEKAFRHVYKSARQRRINYLRWQVTQTTDEKSLRKITSQLYAEITAESGRDYYEVDPEHPSPDMQCLLTIGGVNCFPKKELSAIKAKAKNGKTHLGQIICAAAIARNAECCGVTRMEGLEPLKVLFVDTEQSYASSDKLYRNVLRMGGYDTGKKNGLLTVINLRLTNKEQRIGKIKMQLIEHQYDLVVVDGIKDLAHDINDNKEADKILVDLLAIIQEYDVNMTVVLHENPGKDDDKMRGHLGTETLNKAFEVFAVAKDKDTGVFNVENRDRREKEVPTWAFHFVPNADGEGEHLEVCDTEEGSGSGSQAPTKKEKDWNVFTKAFEDDPNLSHTQEEIVQILLRRSDISEATIKRRIKKYAARKRLVVQESDGIQRYGLSTEEKIRLNQRLHPEPGQEPPIVGINSSLWDTNDDCPY